MIISDIVLNHDCPTTDVIMNTGLTITDVIIYDLAHFADLYSDDLNPTAIILKTSADVMPYIIMFDHSTQLTNIDDVYIAELDPFTLPEIDMMNGYYHGMRLQAEFALQSIMYIVSNELSSTLQSSMSLSIFPLVKDYDDWFITDMDSHSIHHLEKEIE